MVERFVGVSSLGSTSVVGRNLERREIPSCIDTKRYGTEYKALRSRGGIRHSLRWLRKEHLIYNVKATEVDD